MSIAPKSFIRINNVPALPTRTFTLASAARRRHSAFTPALHPNSSKNNTTTELAPLLLTYSALLFSLPSPSSESPSSHDQPFASVELPSTKVTFEAQMGLDPSIPSWLWLSKGLWDCCTPCLRTSVRLISHPVPFPADSRGMPHSPSLAVFVDVRTVVCSSRWRHHCSHSLRCGTNSPTDFSHTLDGFLTCYLITVARGRPLALLTRQIDPFLLLSLAYLLSISSSYLAVTL
ncbi:hypothetical protein EDB87DRAFT_1611416 [Lactarius vividus]|nr:hypothetical protein EDB87DRAFT_1611416 [Lactarius vividus]